MKYIVPFLALFAVIALNNEFYILGTIILLFIVFGIFLAMKSGGSIYELHLNMPTVWQDITETLGLGQRYWFRGTAIDLRSIYKFYRTMEIFDTHFEFKLDEQVLLSFEKKYGAGNAYPNIPARTRILYHYFTVMKLTPGLLPEIQKAILVRKKVRGEKKPDKEMAEKSFKPAFV